MNPLLYVSAAFFPVLVAVVAYHIGRARGRRPAGEIYERGWHDGRKSERADQSLEPVS
jgi:hypothetical protein